MRMISKPRGKLALIDLDGTIIDRKTNQLNDDRLRPTVEAAQSSGWTVALSSDTPLVSLRIWSNRFGIRGPIVAEKGGLIEIDGNLVYPKPEIAEMFRDSISLVVARLKNLNINVVFGTPVEMMFKGARYSEVQGEKVVFANDLRRTSLGLFVLKTDEDGKLIPDKESTPKVFDAIQDCLPVFPTIAKWKGDDRGLIVVSDGEINKRNGSLLLMRRLGVEEAAMIGDSAFDYIGNDIAKHYAVGNADDAFKSMADYVADADLTSGVVEILTSLIRS